jgi:hypothetical protein
MDGFPTRHPCALGGAFCLLILFPCPAGASKWGVRGPDPPLLRLEVCGPCVPSCPLSNRWPFPESPLFQLSASLRPRSFPFR